MNKTVQAKHISDERAMSAIRAVRSKWVVDRSMLPDIQECLSEFPPKVVMAKLAALVKKKKIEGCLCGCNGDFEEPKQ